MTTYIILLRGINVSGQKKIIMSALKEMLQHLDFVQVQTYIQSGNIVLRSYLNSSKKVSQIIKEGIFNTFGFDVLVITKTFLEWQEIFNQSPFPESNSLDTKKWYYVLLQEAPSKELIYSLQQEQFPNTQFVIFSSCVYLNCDQGYGTTKCDNNFFEKRLKVSATTRNHRSMMKLLQMAEAINLTSKSQNSKL